jgi:predicted transcriptional regulator
MKHTPEQRDIIRRIHEVNTQIEEITAAHDEFQIAETEILAALGSTLRALTATMERTAEMHRLCREHGELFRKYLDTLL